MIDRSRDSCNRNYEYLPPALKGNPVVGNGVRELAFGAEGQSDEEIVIGNAEMLNVHFDISQASNRGGTHTKLDNGVLVSKQEQYAADLYVDSRDGKILDVSYDETTELELMYGKYTAKLEIQVLIDHEAFTRNHQDYQPYQFAINGAEDLETGQPLPLQVLLTDRAIFNLESTLEICNDLSA